MPSGQLLRVVGDTYCVPGPGGKRWVSNPWNNTGFSINREDNTRLVKLGIDSEISGNTLRFSPDDRHFAWGDATGNVYIADLVEVQQRLAPVGLGW
jgi:hypothetical protein